MIFPPDIMNAAGSASEGILNFPRSKSWIVSSIRAQARSASRSDLTEMVRLNCRPAYRKEQADLAGLRVVIA